MKVLKVLRHGASNARVLLDNGSTAMIPRSVMVTEGDILENILDPDQMKNILNDSFERVPSCRLAEPGEVIHVEDMLPSFY